MRPAGGNPGTVKGGPSRRRSSSRRGKGRSGGRAGIGKRAIAGALKFGGKRALKTVLDGSTSGVWRAFGLAKKVGDRIGWGKVLFLMALPNLIGVFVVLVIAAGVIASTLALVPQTGGTGPFAVPGIPPVALDAYRQGAAGIMRLAPNSKGITWSLLAAISKVESNHGRGAKEDHTLAANGDISPPFVGPRLDGSGAGGNTTPVYDTDNGRLDGDTTYDRAVGPMQFMPGTWRSEGHDGNGDGKIDPQNYYDAVLSTAVYLSGDGNADLTDPGQLYRAIYRYNHSHDYVRKVLGLAEQYEKQGQMALPGPMGSGAGQAIVAAALQWLGTPYLWGGGGIDGPTTGCGHGFCGTGFDCSGLTTYALYHGTGRRINVGSYTVTQFNDPRGVHVSWSEMRPGDLVFFNGLSHVGIYMGGGRFVHAPQTGDVVKISPIDGRRSSFDGAVRYV